MIHQSNKLLSVDVVLLRAGYANNDPNMNKYKNDLQLFIDDSNNNFLNNEITDVPDNQEDISHHLHILPVSFTPDQNRLPAVDNVHNRRTCLKQKRRKNQAKEIARKKRVGQFLEEQLASSSSESDSNANPTTKLSFHGSLVVGTKSLHDLTIEKLQHTENIEHIDLMKNNTQQNNDHVETNIDSEDHYLFPGDIIKCNEHPFVMFSRPSLVTTIIRLTKNSDRIIEVANGEYIGNDDLIQKVMEYKSDNLLNKISKWQPVNTLIVEHDGVFEAEVEKRSQQLITQFDNVKKNLSKTLKEHGHSDGLLRNYRKNIKK